MSTLIQLQRAFQAYVYDREGGMLTYVVGNTQVTAEERLNVYAEAYRLRLIEVLGNEFPGLRALVGEQGFEVLAQGYIQSSPSSKFNVRWYGAGLADFLGSVETWMKDPALAEMAAWESAMSLVFDARDESTMTIADIATVAPADWPAMTPVLQNALLCMSLRWNVAAIRKAVDEMMDIPTLSTLEIPEHRLVWRKELTVYHRMLEPDEAWAIQALGDKLCFGELCAGLCRWHDEEAIPFRAAALLRRWVEDGLISEFRLPANSRAVNNS